MRKIYFVNNQIRAQQVRVIDEQGKQLGIFDLEKAIKIAKEKGLDLVLVAEKASPPVCRIVNFGKFLYLQKKKEREKKAKQKVGSLKNIRLTYKISPHDLEIRVKKAKEFLEKGYKIRIEMKLRGREKRLEEFAKEKVNFFISKLKEKIDLKIERALKKEPRGLTMIISKL